MSYSYSYIFDFHFLMNLYYSCVYIIFRLFPCSYIFVGLSILVFVNIVTHFYKFYLITNILLTIFCRFFEPIHLFQWILYPKNPEQMLFQYPMWTLKRSLMSLRISYPQTQAPNSRGNRCSAPNSRGNRSIRCSSAPNSRGNRNIRSIQAPDPGLSAKICFNAAICSTVLTPSAANLS